MSNASLKKMELEKNNFIRKLSQEQFDGVVTNKYKKLFHEYFDGTIGESELAKKVESNMELIEVYENGNVGKIDPNQYLYCAIVDVALDYFNVANSYETCLNKLNLLASYFQLVSSVNVLLEFLDELIFDVFSIYEFEKNNECEFDKFVKQRKMDRLKNIAIRLDELFVEIAKHEDVIVEVEKTSKMDFVDESLIGDDIKEMYVHYKDLAKSTKDEFKKHVDFCIDESIGVKLDIMKGKLIE